MERSTMPMPSIDPHYLNSRNSCSDHVAEQLHSRPEESSLYQMQNQDMSNNGAQEILEMSLDYRALEPVTLAFPFTDIEADSSTQTQLPKKPIVKKAKPRRITTPGRFQLPVYNIADDGNALLEVLKTGGYIYFVNQIQKLNAGYLKKRVVNKAWNNLVKQKSKLWHEACGMTNFEWRQLTAELSKACSSLNSTLWWAEYYRKCYGEKAMKAASKMREHKKDGTGVGSKKSKRKEKVKISENIGLQKEMMDLIEGNEGVRLTKSEKKKARMTRERRKKIKSLRKQKKQKNQGDRSAAEANAKIARDIQSLEGAIAAMSLFGGDMPQMRTGAAVEERMDMDV